MKRKERMAKTLAFQPVDRPPHFEQLFELTEEAFGISIPDNEEIERSTGAEREKLFEQCAEMYAKIIEKYQWDAILVAPPVMGVPHDDPNHPIYAFIPYLKNYLQAYFHEEIPVGAFLWCSVICIDTIRDYMEFAVQLLEDREGVRAWAEDMYERALLHTSRLLDAGADFVNIGSDHAFNSGTLLSPDDFAEFVTPYLKKLVRYIQSRGAWAMMHSDGNLMGVMDQILEIKPNILQSIDPQAGMDIAEVKRMAEGKIALMGNVQCSYLQSGTPEQIEESCEYCLEHAAPGSGYIYSSSNTIFREIPLESYDLMLKKFHEKYSESFGG